MGDNLRKTIVEETVAACDACGADIDGPVDRERRVLYDIVFEVVERRAEIKECPKCKARTKGRFPDNIPCSTASAFRPSSSTCWLPKCCPCAVPSRSCRRSPASSSPRQPASAMLSRCARVMGGGRRGAPPATPDVDDFGSTVSGFMSWDPDVQVPAPQARPGGKRSARATRASWASYMGQCSHQLCGSHLLRELTFVVEATARLMKSLLREVCHKVNKSASKTLNDAGPCANATAPSGRQGTARYPAAAERKTWTQVRRAQPARTSRETREPALHRRPSR